MFLCGNTQQKKAEIRRLIVLFRPFVVQYIYGPQYKFYTLPALTSNRKFPRT